MILDQFLNESYGYSNIPDVEASNEGFDFEHGGFHEVIGLAESGMHKMRLAEMAVECKSVQLLAENSMESFNLLQENVVTSFFAKIKEIVTKLWKRMKEVINTVKMYFQKIVSDKAFLASAKKALEKHVDWSGLEYEGFNFTLDAVNPKAIYNECAKAIASSIDGVNLNEALLKKAAPEENEKKEIKKMKEELDKVTTDEAVKKVISTKAMENKSFADAKNYFFKKFRSGKDTKEKVTFDKTAALNAIETLNSSINTAKAISSDIDTTHKTTLDAIETERKEAEKFEGENSGTNVNVLVSKCTKKTKAIETALSFSNNIVSWKIDALRARSSQSKDIIMKAISKSKKNEKEMQSNSAYDEESVLDFFMNRL